MHVQSGQVYTGANVENACRGLAMCTERVAIGKAVSEGHRRFRAIAIVAPGPSPSPCGACRQTLAEFGESIVICTDARHTRRLRIHLLSKLLPEPFRLASTRHRLPAVKKKL
jgi:cytidine deaminase